MIPARAVMPVRSVTQVQVNALFVMCVTPVRCRLHVKRVTSARSVIVVNSAFQVVITVIRVRNAIHVTPAWVV